MNSMPILLAQQAVTDGGEYFLGIENPDYRFVIVLTAIGCVTLLLLVIGCVVAASWNAIRQREVEAELKQDMLDRGMSAEEIEQVVKAQPKEGLDHWMEVWAKKKRG